MSLPVRGLGVARGAVGAALCALAAHGFLYRSLWPSSGAHGYFGWYQPLVGGLSLIALVVLAIVLIAGLLGIRSRPIDWLSSVFRCPEEDRSSRSALVVRLAGASLLVLLVQESVERSIESGSPTVASFTPVAWLVAIAVLSALAAAIVLATRSCAALLDRVLGAGGRRRITQLALPLGHVVLFARPGRCKPLASGWALRAPPALAG
jgi:hypothetical protein